MLVLCNVKFVNLSAGALLEPNVATDDDDDNGDDDEYVIHDD